MGGAESLSVGWTTRQKTKPGVELAGDALITRHSPCYLGP